MALFAQQPRFLGVDFGNHNVKVVELANQNGRPRLVTYGYSDTVGAADSIELVNQPEVAAATLKKVLKRANVTSHQVIASLPVSAVFSSILTITPERATSAQELDNAIEWEAKKVLPRPVEEMIIEYNELTKAGMLPAINPTESTNSARRFLLTAAPRVLVRKYLEIFKLAGCNVLSLETESFALIRSLIGNDKVTVAVVDLGEVTTNIAIIQRGVPLLNRSVSVAGNSFTKALAQQSKMERTAAERLKRDLSVAGQQSAVAESDRLVETLIHEIQYCFGLYQQEHLYSHDSVERVILTGGSAALPGLDTTLEKKLGIRVYLGDPWARIIYPEDLKPVLDSVGPRLSIAVGLALRDIIA